MIKNKKHIFIFVHGLLWISTAFTMDEHVQQPSEFQHSRLEPIRVQFRQMRDRFNDWRKPKARFTPPNIPFEYISSDRFKNTPSTEIPSLSPHDLVNVNINNLSPEQISMLTQAQVQSLPIDQVMVLEKQSLQAFPFAALSNDQIADIVTTNTAGILQNVTLHQLGKLNKSQILECLQARPGTFTDEQIQFLQNLGRVKGISRFNLPFKLSDLIKSKQTKFNETIRELLTTNNNEHLQILFEHATNKEIQKALTAYEKNSIQTEEKTSNNSWSYQQTKTKFKNDAAKYQKYLKPNQLLIPIEETDKQNKESFEYEIIDISSIKQKLDTFQSDNIDMATIRAMARKLKSQQGLKIRLSDIQTALTDYVKHNQTKTNIVTTEARSIQPTDDDDSELKDEEPITQTTSSSTQTEPENNGALITTEQKTTQNFDQNLRILGFKPGTIPTESEILQKFRAKSLAAHPDKSTGSKDAMQELAQAKDELLAIIHNPAELKLITSHTQPAELEWKPSSLIQRQLLTELESLQNQETAERNATLQAEFQDTSDLIRNMPKATSQTLINEYTQLLDNLKQQQKFLTQETHGRSTIESEALKKLQDEFNLQKLQLQRIQEAEQRLILKNSQDTQRSNIEQEEFQNQQDINRYQLELEQLRASEKLFQDQANETKSITKQAQLTKKIQDLQTQEANNQQQLLQEYQRSVSEIQKALTESNADSATKQIMQDETNEFANLLTQFETNSRTMTADEAQNSFEQIQKLYNDLRDQKTILLQENLDRFQTPYDERSEFETIAKQFAKEKQSIELKQKNTQDVLEKIKTALQSPSDNPNTPEEKIANNLKQFQSESTEIQNKINQAAFLEYPTMISQDGLLTLKSIVEKSVPFDDQTRELIQELLLSKTDSEKNPYLELTNFYHEAQKNINTEITNIKQKLQYDLNSTEIENEIQKQLKTIYDEQIKAIDTQVRVDLDPNRYEFNKNTGQYHDSERSSTAQPSSLLQPIDTTQPKANPIAQELKNEQEFKNNLEQNITKIIKNPDILNDWLKDQKLTNDQVQEILKNPQKIQNNKAINFLNNLFPQDTDLTTKVREITSLLQSAVEQPQIRQALQNQLKINEYARQITSDFPENLYNDFARRNAPPNTPNPFITQWAGYANKPLAVLEHFFKNFVFDPAQKDNLMQYLYNKFPDSLKNKSNLFKAQVIKQILNNPPTSIEARLKNQTS